MNETLLEKKTGHHHVLLGDEALALGAIHAGITAAYAYPGTPSTEITEYVLQHARREGRPIAQWCANEKTAYEEALGTCLVGKRALVSMKHVGLNVAADPFVNSALVEPHGGLVVAVADDPGMHSSQNEQDTRHYADMARVPCFDPADQQQAYDMTREAFELSERFRVPVVLRVVTRLAHSRTTVEVQEPRAENELAKPPRPASWILLPGNARKQWASLLERHDALEELSNGSRWNPLELTPKRCRLGVITTGIARNYFLEAREQLEEDVSHLHVGFYPYPKKAIRQLAEHCDEILVLEEGQAFVERHLRGILPPALRIRGKESGELPRTGELNPDLVKAALGLSVPKAANPVQLPLPGRPPQLCSGCPHRDLYVALKEALQPRDEALVVSDIGCYTLGALPPYQAIESCVCMGASIGMAKGAAEAGLTPVVAVIGDSTFLHSGITPLMDAAAHDVNMTLVILDNEVVAMTGAQPTLFRPASLVKVVEGVLGKTDHLRVLQTHPSRIDELISVLREEIAHPGLSVVVAERECIEGVKRRKQEEREAQEGAS